MESGFEPAKTHCRAQALTLSMSGLPDAFQDAAYNVAGALTLPEPTGSVTCLSLPLPNFSLCLQLVGYIPGVCVPTWNDSS